MVSCETSEATSNSFVGIILVLLACVCYASGNCLQRYSLLRQEGEKVFGILNRHAGWTLGAIVYFSANGIYAVALSFAPVSVLAAVFSLTIVANATCAVWILGDPLPRTSYPGYVCVLIGSIVFAVTIQAEVCHFGPNELKQVMTSPSAIVYWIFVGAVILGGILFAWRFENQYQLPQQQQEPTTRTTNDDNNNKGDGSIPVDTIHTEPATEHALNVIHDPDENNTRGTESHDGYEMQQDSTEPSSLLLLAAGILYPASLGATEAAGALLLKAINSLLTTMATDDGGDGSDSSSLGLWIGLMGVGIFVFVGIVIWLRLVYRRFEITAAFPVEFGVLTFASVVGGFAVFHDHQYVDSTYGWIWVSVATLFILGGIAIVAIASWRFKVVQQQQQQQQEKAEPASCSASFAVPPDEDL